MAYDADQVGRAGDPQALRASFANVRALREALGDLVILASHDPRAEATLAAATRAAA